MATNVYGNGTNSTAGANTILHFYDKAGIKSANRVDVYAQFASRKDMPTKMGKTFKISKFLHMYDRNQATDGDFAARGYMTSRDLDTVTASLNASTLAEGVSGVNKRSLNKVTFSTDFARYGEMIDYSDEVELFSEDAIQVRYREELGEMANARFEDLIQLDMLSTATKMYAGSATSMATLGTAIAVNGSTDAAWQVSYDLITRSVRKLVRNRAKKVTSMITGDTKVDTKTVDAAFYAIVGADVKADLGNLTRIGKGGIEEFVFIPVSKYAAAGTLVQGEVGAMHEVRFIEAESAVVEYKKGADVPAGYVGALSYTGVIGTDAKFDVFPILFPTQDAFATIGLKGQDKIKFNSKAPSDIDSGNTYGTVGFFSYNFWYAGLILEEEKMLRVDVLASR